MLDDVRSWLGLLLLAGSLIGCGEPMGGVDAGVVDARSPPDAAQCSVGAAPLPAADSTRAEIVFDQAIASVADDRHPPVAIFVDGGELVLFSVRAVYRMTLDGLLVSSAPLAGTGPLSVELRRVVRGSGHYGAMVFIRDGVSVRDAFCVLDEDGSFDAARCTTISSQQDGPVVFDGFRYQVYGEIDGRLRRNVYDATGTLQVVPDFPETEGVTVGVVAAAGTANADHVLAFDYLDGAACPRLREHVVARTGEHTARELLPADVGLGRFGDPAIVVSDDRGDVAVVLSASCLVSGCETAPEVAGLLDTSALDGFAIPVSGLQRFVLWDEGRTVVIDETTFCDEESPTCFRCSTGGKLSRFAADGRTELFGVELIEPQEGYSLEVVAAVVGAGDYALAYLRPGGLRVARVLVP